MVRREGKEHSLLENRRPVTSTLCRGGICSAIHFDGTSPTLAFDGSSPELDYFPGGLGHSGANSIGRLCDRVDQA